MLILIKKHMAGKKFKKKSIYQFNITNALLEAKSLQNCLPPSKMGSWMIPTTWPAHRIFRPSWPSWPPSFVLRISRPSWLGLPVMKHHTLEGAESVYFYGPSFSAFLLFQTFRLLFQKNAEGLDIKTINPLKLAWLVDRCWPFLERYTDHAKKLLEEGCQVAPSNFPLSSFTNTCIFISCFQVLTTIPAFHDLVAVCINSEPLFKQGEKNNGRS